MLLGLMLQQSKEQTLGLRSFDEIAALVSRATHVRQENPNDYYAICQKIGQGGFANVFEVRSKANNKLYAAKMTN